MSTSVRGVIPPDKEFKKMMDVYDACEKAGVPIPKEVDKFFNYSTPDPVGMEVEINDCVEELSDGGIAGYLVDLSKVPKNVKFIKFENSW